MSTDTLNPRDNSADRPDESNIAPAESEWPENASPEDVAASEDTVAGETSRDDGIAAPRQNN